MILSCRDRLNNASENIHQAIRLFLKSVQKTIMIVKRWLLPVRRFRREDIIGHTNLAAILDNQLTIAIYETKHRNRGTVKAGGFSTIKQITGR